MHPTAAVSLVPVKCEEPPPPAWHVSVLLEVTLMPDFWLLSLALPWQVGSPLGLSETSEHQCDKHHLLQDAGKDRPGPPAGTGFDPGQKCCPMPGRVAVRRHESRLLGELLSAACAALFTAASHVCSSHPLPAPLTEQSPGPCCPLRPCPTSRHPSRSPLHWMMRSGVPAHLCKRREGRSSWHFAWHIVDTPSCVLRGEKGREALLSRSVRTGGSLEGMNID